eukprot:COSAG06_NODE_2272_length_7196_cov_4.916314_7_plen_127_part_00
MLCCRETLGLTRIASTKSFLAAKDGPPNVVSYPGWLGVADLGLFSLGFIPSLLGLFKVFDGDTHTYCCLSCFLFVPHYLDDFFCYQVPCPPPHTTLPFIYARSSQARSHDSRNATNMIVSHALCVV